MTNGATRRLTSLNTVGDTQAEIFIGCASFEDRCLGALSLLSANYRFDHSYLCIYDDPNEARQPNVKAMAERLQSSGPTSTILTSKHNPSRSIAKLLTRIRALALKSQVNVTLDVSTFTKRHLLLLLLALDDAGLWESLRLIYTEPKDYVVDMYLPMSVGIKEVAPIPGFTNIKPPDKPVLLVIMLGYEGDRAMALFQSIEPNETVLLVPRPAYRPEWEGRTEELNRQLVSLLGEDAIVYADSRDPLQVKIALNEVLDTRYPTENWTCLVSPLGTKPQTVGLYLLWRDNPGSCAIVYAQPLRHNKRYYSKGSGPTWELGIR